MALSAAQRQANYRARKAAEAAARGDVTGNSVASHDVTPPTPAPTVMQDAVESSLKAMKWLVDSDDAAKAQARMLAKSVDELQHAGDTTKALSAHRALTKVLNDLGGTPMRRMMHELRSLRGGTGPEVPDDEDSEREAGQQPGNVSEFKRPPRRSEAG